MPQPPPRSCHVVRSEKAGVVVRFPGGADGYVPRAELYWRRDRRHDPRHDFKPDRPLDVVPLGTEVDGLPAYSHRWADPGPWDRTLGAIDALHAGGRAEVAGTVVWAQADRAHVAVPGFEVDAVVPHGLLPLDDFPAYFAGRPVGDALFDGDAVRGVVEGTDRAAGHVVLSVRAARDAAPPPGGRAGGGPGLVESSPQLRALWNRLERQDEAFGELKEYGSPHAVAVACPDWETAPALVGLLAAVGFAAAPAGGPPGPDDPPPDAVVFDADRSLARGQLEPDLRLWAAAAPAARRVLVFSDLTAEAVGQLRAAGGLFHGAVRKWAGPKAWLAAVRAALDAAPPRFDPDQPPDGPAWREWTMAAAVDHERNRDDALAVVLNQLQIGLGAAAVALVRFDLNTRKAGLVGAAGRGLDFDAARPHLDKSPVRDIVEDHEVYRVADTLREDTTYRYLYDLFPQPGGRTRAPFRSFLGMRLVDFGRGSAQRAEHDRSGVGTPRPPADDRESYALLAFHPDPNAFPNAAAQLFCRAAVLLLTLLERDAVRQELIRFSGLVTIARQSSFLVHEFRSRTGAVLTWNRLLEADLDQLAAHRTPPAGLVDRLRATAGSLGRVAGTLAQVNEVFLNLSVEGRRPFRVGSVVDELRLVFRDQLGELNARLTTDFQWDGQVVSNRGQLAHVLSNLIQNALDQFRLSGCRRAEVRVGVECLPADPGGHPSPPRVKVTVADNGVGIPQYQYRQIFDYSFSTKPDGSGIGLHVSRLIASKLGGSLVLEASERFVRTRFAVTLPIT